MFLLLLAAVLALVRGLLLLIFSLIGFSVILAVQKFKHPQIIMVFVCKKGSKMGVTHGDVSFTRK